MNRSIGCGMPCVCSLMITPRNRCTKVAPGCWAVSLGGNGDSTRKLGHLRGAFVGHTTHQFRFLNHATSAIPDKTRMRQGLSSPLAAIRCYVDLNTTTISHLEHPESPTTIRQDGVS